MVYINQNKTDLQKDENLFCVKSKNPHPARVIYEWMCACQKSCIGETKRNVEIWWEECW